jgi:hypothetical protein
VSPMPFHCHECDKPTMHKSGLCFDHRDRFIADGSIAKGYHDARRKHEDALMRARRWYAKGVISDKELMDIEAREVPLLKKAIIAYADYMENGFIS